jgi:predicted DNA-binding transcriptional regulator AlpA
MNSEESLSSSKPAAPYRVSLSPFVNERLPNWEEILSAHDVARLTRRPHWVIAGLILVRRFPRKRRYHGRGIGWLRSDIIQWLSKDLRTTPYARTPEQAFRARIIRQASFSFNGAEPFMRRGRRRAARRGATRDDIK